MMIGIDNIINDTEQVVKIQQVIKETKDIGKYYSASDAFLFTSHLESFPKVIQEAMFLKLPIVSTDTFGIKEQVFHNSSALLCNVGNIIITTHKSAGTIFSGSISHAVTIIYVST